MIIIILEQNLKKIDSKDFDDSGDMVDYYLINSKEEYYKEESDYILNEENYLIEYEGFRRGLLSIKKNNQIKISKILKTRLTDALKSSVNCIIVITTTTSEQTIILH